VGRLPILFALRLVFGIILQLFSLFLCKIALCTYVVKLNYYI